MTARLLGPGDAALWRALWAEALAAAPQAFARRSGDDPEVLAARLAAVRPFVWECAAPCGAEAVACALWRRDDDPSASRRGWVEAVFVRPASRGRGIAARLIAALAADARSHGVAELWLEVGRDNAPARAAYARAGFGPAPTPAARADEIALCLPLGG